MGRFKLTFEERKEIGWLNKSVKPLHATILDNMYIAN